MKNDIKAKWLEALRSGRYEQGTGRLRNYRNQFCCLGVLCDVLDNSKWSTFCSAPVYGDMVSGLSSDLLDRVGISEGAQDALIRQNDSVGASFKEIADWIEQNL